MGGGETINQLDHCYEVLEDGQVNLIGVWSREKL